MGFSVSVIIPVHNGQRYLAEAIESVLSQGHTPLELIVVDDGSTDGTAEVARQFGDRVRYAYQERRGPAAARNRGIALARGEVLGFLDHDDWWAQGSVREFSAILAAAPRIEIVQGLIVQVQGVRTHEGVRFEESSEPYQFISVTSALYRRQIFERVGEFDEGLWEGEDTDWFLRAWEKNIVKVVLPRVMLYYRRHESNLTHDSGPRTLPRLFKKHIDRLRAANVDRDTRQEKHANVGEYIGLPPRRLRQRNVG